MRPNILIDQEQARIIARCIYSDIAAYIKSHPKEYEEYLLKQKNGGKKNENRSTCR